MKKTSARADINNIAPEWQLLKELDALRIDDGITQSRLASMAGHNVKWYHNRIHSPGPGISFICQIAELLGYEIVFRKKADIKNTRLPKFFDELKCAGQMVWVELEGFVPIVRREAGNLAFVENSIMGWNCRNLTGIREKRRAVNYAPRVRFWEGDIKPTSSERANMEWSNTSRLWMPSVADQNREERISEWERNGRTVWSEEPEEGADDE